MELSTKLKGKLGKAFNDNVYSDEKVEVSLQPSAQGEAIAVTDRRVMIIKAGHITGAGLFGASVKSFPFEQITAVDLRTGIMGGHMQVSAAGTSEVKDTGFNAMFKAENAITFTGKFKKEMQAVAEMIRSRLGRQQQQAAPTGGITDEIKKLAELKDQGILSEEQFEAAKKKLL